MRAAKRSGAVMPHVRIGDVLHAAPTDPPCSFPSSCRHPGGSPVVEQSARPEAAELILWTSYAGKRGSFVEVDGATHSEDREIAYDRRREAYLNREGYRIVRVLN